MTLQEFSNGFDLLYNNITSNKAPGLNEYEKSILLTKAQETLVTDFYKGNFNLDTFESTEDVSKYLSNLIEAKILTIEDVDVTLFDKRINDKSILFKSPDDMLFITYEYVIMNNYKLINGFDIPYKVKVEVLPTTQDSFNATYKNPFKFIPDKRVLRLLFQNRIEIFLPPDTKDIKYSLDSYYIRYIKKPQPIILENLSDYKITIEGVSEKTDCKLDSSFHKFILEKAVLLAKNLWANEV